MFRRSVCSALALAAAAGATSIATAAQAAPITEITPSSHIHVVPLKNAAMIQKTQHGYRYIAGQQDSHLTIRVTNGAVRYTDTGTQQLRRHPKTCHQQSAGHGIDVVCRLPQRFRSARQTFLEVWPRLGNDWVSGASLPAKYRLWMLGDKGNDTFYGGAGRDFFNGAQDNDTAYGGAGADWIRTGTGNDRIWGDGGNDKLVGTDGADEMHGGAGNDGVYGGNGNDRLWADGGRDVLQCAGGSDGAFGDGDDRMSSCEAVSRS